MADEKEVMKNIQNLLAGTTLLQESYQQAKKKYAGKLAPDFNLFDFFRIDENTLSKCLAFLLDPDETHAQGDLFLRKFYKLIGCRHYSDDEKSSQVYTEYLIDKDRRIDIVIQNENSFIGIENKPWASDQKDQLKDYACWLEVQAQKKNRQALLIFLSNKDISTFSLPPEKPGERRCPIRQVTFIELEEWLTDCSVYVEAPVVRCFTDALIQFVRTDINGEVAVELQKDLVGDLISSPQKMEAAILIANNVQKAKGLLWSRFISFVDEKITKDEKLTKSGISIYGDERLQDGRRWSCFYILFNKDDRYSLCWEFEYANYQGLALGIRSASIKPDGDMLKKDFSLITEKMQKIFPQINAKMEKHGWWPWWCYVDEAMNIPRNWYADPKAWSLLFDEGKDGLAQKVIDITLLIKDKIDNNDNFLK